MPGFHIPSQAKGCPSADQTGPKADLETSRDHRWKITICEPLRDILINAKKCTRPSPEIDHITYHNGINECYMPAKLRFRPVEFTFYSVIKNDVDTAASNVYKWWSSKVYDLRNNSITKNFKKVKVILEMLDGKGNKVRRYTLHKCLPELVSPSDLDYSANEIALVTIRLKYDYYEEDQDQSNGGPFG